MGRTLFPIINQSLLHKVSDLCLPQGVSGFSLQPFIPLDLAFPRGFSPLPDPEHLQAGAYLVGPGDPPEG